MGLVLPIVSHLLMNKVLLEDSCAHVLTDWLWLLS
jgi:hypothetical protein